MIALVAAIAAVATAKPVPTFSPQAVIARYTAALAALHEPRVFTVEYTLEQTGVRTREQTHRIFRSGGDERDETLAVNGTRSNTPVVRIFRNRPYRYSVSALAPKPGAYAFTYVGPRKSARHVDYVFNVTPKNPTRGFAFTQIAIDGVAFLPESVAFETSQHAGRGTVTFAKADRYWTARSATARADVSAGVAHERLTFSNWRFPKTLPRSTFAVPRALPILPPPAG